MLVVERLPGLKILVQLLQLFIFHLILYLIRIKVFKV